MTVFTSSKGTQEKWLKDDYFYKRDFFGGEAEAEFLVYEFLKSCGIEDYVPYEKVGSDLCRSQNFIPEGGSFFTMFRLLQQRVWQISNQAQLLKNQSQPTLFSKSCTALEVVSWLFVRYLIPYIPFVLENHHPNLSRK